MHRIIEAAAASDSAVNVRFEDGMTATIDFSGIADRGGVFHPFRDPSFFHQVRIGADGRSLEWPDDLDFCADALWLEANSPSKTNIEPRREPAPTG